MDEQLQERLARNEIAFRTINNGIHQATQTILGDAGHWEFLCECSDHGCREVVHLSIDEYERVRSNDAWFCVAPGHDEQLVERLVDTSDRFWLVEKRGHARRVVERDAQ